MIKYLLSAGDLTRDQAIEILDIAEGMADVNDREIKKLPTLRGRTAEQKAEICTQVERHVWPWIAAGIVKPVIDRVMPITDAAREALGRRSIPLPYSRWTALSSPLARCLQTAAALDLRVTLEPRLAEMDWGGYQGHTIEALRKSGGAGHECAVGLHSPDRAVPLHDERKQQVCDDLQPWLQTHPAGTAPRDRAAG